MSEKVDALIEEIKGLTVLELAEAVKAMEEEFGVSAAAPVAVAGAAAPAAGGDGAAAAEKSDYDVVITEPGQEKVKVIKVVKDITGLGLKDAKALVDGAPKAVKEGVPEAEANEIKTKLEEVGATVELK